MLQPNLRRAAPYLQVFAQASPSTCKTVVRHDSRRPISIGANVPGAHSSWSVHHLQGDTWPLTPWLLSIVTPMAFHLEQDFVTAELQAC